jgi:hypothetical protein
MVREFLLVNRIFRIVCAEPKQLLEMWGTLILYSSDLGRSPIVKVELELLPAEQY